MKIQINRNATILNIKIHEYTGYIQYLLGTYNTHFTIYVE
jgi:hypothetical protein